MPTIPPPDLREYFDIVLRSHDFSRGLTPDPGQSFLLAGQCPLEARDAFYEDEHGNLPGTLAPVASLAAAQTTTDQELEDVA